MLIKYFRNNINCFCSEAKKEIAQNADCYCCGLRSRRHEFWFINPSSVNCWDFVVLEIRKNQENHLGQYVTWFTASKFHVHSENFIRSEFCGREMQLRPRKLKFFRFIVSSAASIIKFLLGAHPKATKISFHGQRRRRSIEFKSTSYEVATHR